MLYETVNKALNWGVKLARSLAVTGPATWMVATDLFSDIQQPTILFVMRFSAVFLIEGVMLSNWLLLEFDKHATPEIKARYGLTALAMYMALLMIGWRLSVSSMWTVYPKPLLIYERLRAFIDLEEVL